METKPVLGYSIYIIQEVPFDILNPFSFQIIDVCYLRKISLSGILCALLAKSAASS